MCTNSRASLTDRRSIVADDKRVKMRRSETEDVVLVVAGSAGGGVLLAPRVTSEGLRQWCGRLCGYSLSAMVRDGCAAEGTTGEEGWVERSRGRRGGGTIARGRHAREGDRGGSRGCRMEDAADAK